MHKMDAITNLLQAQLHAHIDTSMTSGEKATAFILLASTTVGFFFLTSKIYSFVRLLFSLFILPGIPVSHHPFCIYPDRPQTSF